MPSTRARTPHPSVFFVLILPYGVSFGYVAIALPYLATHHGVSAEAAGAVVAAAFGPHAIKFLWAPVVDTTLTKKAWYLIALAMVIAGTVASAAMPITAGTIGLLTTIVVASQVGLTLLNMACENFLAYCVPESGKGRAAGWYQAGSLAGNGCGGGLALWLSQRLAAGWMVGAVLGGLMVVSALPLLVLDEPGRSALSFGRALKHLAADLKNIALSRAGMLGVLVCLSPVGAGAAQYYFGPIADTWHTPLDTVALVTGVLTGIVQAAGAMGAGLLADRMDRKLVYCAAGALTAVSGLLMAAAPHTKVAYVVFALAYAMFQGAAMAAFSAFVLETIGLGAAATKYNILASIANFAIKYMIRLDGVFHTRYGPNGLLYGDALATFASIAALLMFVAVLGRAWRRGLTGGITPRTTTSLPTVSPSYRVSFLYLILCGVSAAAPRRRLRSTS
ncbi:MAG TPA: MFS transporter [Vicinamibacterales bacterium]|nr:MFS transporter [Vicinamibacterales bacterium]